MKIIIIGESGRGKSTLAKKLSVLTGIKNHSTDDFFWEVKYSKAYAREDALKNIKKEFAKENWIIEGTTYWLLEPGIESADLILFLNFKTIFHQWFSIILRSIKERRENFLELFNLLKHVFYKRFGLGYKKGALTHYEFIKPHRHKVLFLNSFKKINMFLRTYHNSFGIIPLYKKDGKIFICCIQNKKSGEWGLPKGTPENNETQFETAKRELQEETGISEFKIFGGKTFFEEYTFDKGDVSHFKRNTYYLAFVDEMKEKDDIIDARDMKWISLDDIETFFKFESVKKVVREVKNYLDVFPLITEYKGKSGENYLFEYYESDSLEHIPLKSMSQVQVCAFHGDKLLIVNNQNKFNTYSLVGGSIEEGETSEHCLERELKEESNMRLIDFKLIGYQRCTNLSDPSKAPEYQIRYFAQVEPIGPFTPDCDPDGDVTELLEIDPVDYKKYFDWGKTSEVIIERAIRFKDSL